jgi:hypothetical protein
MKLATQSSSWFLFVCHFILFVCGGFYLFIYLVFGGTVWFELRASRLLGRHSTAQATLPPALV